MSGRKTVWAFEKLGWQVARRRGSHIILVKEGEMATLSVPDHREVAKGTLRSSVRPRELRWVRLSGNFDPMKKNFNGCWLGRARHSVCAAGKRPVAGCEDLPVCWRP